MATNDNSKDRIKFACKELEDALAMFGGSEINSISESADDAKNDSRPGQESNQTNAQLSARQEKIIEIKRQLRDIREQLDSLSQ